MKFIWFLLSFTVLQTQQWITSFDNGFKNTPLSYSQKLANKNLVLIGEAHFNSSNPQIFYSYLTKLSKDFGFTEVLLELGYAEGYLLTKYLQNGEDYLIKNNSFYKSSNYRELFKKIYQYNKTLPENKKIQFIGIDYERQKSAIQAILILLDELNLSAKVKEEVFKLDKIYAESTIWDENDSTVNIFNSLYKKIGLIIEKNDKSSKSYIDLMMILENSASSKRMVDRNHDMMTNFSKIYNPSKKYFGQFGGVHVWLEKKYTFASEVISYIEGITQENIEVIRIRYYKSGVLNNKSTRLMTGGGFDFLTKIDGKPSNFDKNFGKNLESGIYIIDLSSTPKKYSNRLIMMYNHIIYVNKTKAVEWER